MSYGGSNDDVIDDVTRVTMKGQVRDPNIFQAHYFENGSR